MRLGSGEWRISGMAMRLRPLKYWPVIESGFAATSAAIASRSFSGSSATRIS